MDTAEHLPPSTGPDPVVKPHAAVPFDLEFVTLSKREHIELRQQASQLRSLHKRAVTRMQSMQCRHDREMAKAREQQAQLKAALVAAQAQIRDLRQRVFGAKTEQSRSINATGQVVAPKTARRARGQQRGRPGHGRTRLDWLPARQEHLRCWRRTKSEPPRRPNIEPGVEADFETVGC